MRRTCVFNCDIKWQKYLLPEVWMPGIGGEKRMQSAAIFWVVGVLMLTIEVGRTGDTPVDQGQMEGVEDAKILTDLLKGYDSRVRPTSTDSGAVVIVCDLYIRTISSINEIAMQYTVDVLIRQSWQDVRLVYNKTSDHETDTTSSSDQRVSGRGHWSDIEERQREYMRNQEYITADIRTVESIWKPDLFFSNEQQGHFHNITFPNILLRIFPDGSVLYSIRLTMSFVCEMKLVNYPFDEQICHMYLGSFTYTTKDVIFMWKTQKPVSLNSKLTLPQFKLRNVTTTTCDNFHYTGNYSCLRVDLFFKREFGYHLVQSYVPTILLVICSWVSFWLDVDAIPARISLGVTTLLTQTTQSTGIRQSLPPVSYTKAIDVWLGACTTYVFAALLEFALVNYVSRKADLALRDDGTSGIVPEDNGTSGRGKPLHSQKSARSGEGTSVKQRLKSGFRRSRLEDDTSFSNDIALTRSTGAGVGAGGSGAPAECEDDRLIMETHTPSMPMVTLPEDTSSSSSQFKPFSGAPTLIPNAKCRSCGGRHVTTLHGPGRTSKRGQEKYARYKAHAKKIDIASRIIFPLTYVVFNVVYWIVYM